MQITLQSPVLSAPEETYKGVFEAEQTVKNEEQGVQITYKGGDIEFVENYNIVGCIE